MPIKTRIEDDIKLFIDFQADEQEFNEWTAKLRSQYLKNVEVPGFRKGKAPEHLAVKQVNPQALEQTVLQEAVDKYGQEAIKEATEEMQTKDKVIIPGSFIIDPASLKRENGLEFTIKGELLPEVKLDPSKIEVKEPSEKDLPERVSFEEFLTSQKNGFISSHAEYSSTDKGVDTLYKFTADTTGKIKGEDASELTTNDMSGVVGIKQFLPDFEKGIKGMKAGEEKEFKVTFPENYQAQNLRGETATFHVQMKSVEAPNSTKFDEVATSGKHEGHNHQDFADEAAFDEYIRNYYDKETKQLLEQQRQRNTIQAILKQVPDFPLDEERIKAEVERIFGVIKSNAESQGVEAAEIFAQSGIPGAEQGAKDEAEIKQKITEYVRNEFKLSTIWDYIYETKIEQKVTPQQIEQGGKEVMQNPARFNLNKDVTEEQARNYAYSNLKKNKAAQWLFGKMAAQKKAEEKSTTKSKETAKKKAPVKKKSAKKADK